jgi:superfamily II DNA or RNA helicase
MSATDVPLELTPARFVSYVQAEADGIASPDQVSRLEAEAERWRVTLLRLLADTEDGLRSVRSLTGPERAQVIADFEDERRSLSAALSRLTGEPDPTEDEDDEADAAAGGDLDQDHESDQDEPGVLRLQLSWLPGRVVAWAAGPRVASADEEHLRELLAKADAPTTGWVPHAPVPLPSGGHADALSLAVGDVLGWLHAAGTGDEADDAGPSVRWLGQIAVWAVALAAQGAMVPLLRQRKRRGRTNEKVGAFSVRWTPALVDGDHLRLLAGAMPGAVASLDTSLDPKSIVQSALTGMVDAICRDAARRVEVPAPPPQVRTAADVAESFLGRLHGEQFEAPSRTAGELVVDLDRWAHPVTSLAAPRLVVQLDSPDEGDAWHLQVLCPAKNRKLVGVEVAMVNAGARRRDIEEQLVRLERLLPELRRPGHHRRGEVILSQAEAWDLMSTTGRKLRTAGFDVRVPALSLRKPKASLRLFADTSTPSAVGARQLANVSWSVLFDDVELTAADIAQLAKEARPLVRSGDRWVAIDHADLQAAAASLAERASTTQLTGAEMLRHALGLEGTALSGGVVVDGTGWAAEVLARAGEVTGPAAAPDGFVGELRSYQGEALAWLSFLDSADLGGCLALDMGLGKTPTMLADLLSHAGAGPALVIAPPAVVGNWAAEAARFTPDLKVVVHHGATRASDDQISAEVAKADVVITTYGTAVRDIESLEKVQWDRVVLDEAQAIKNPANDTAQQLRRLSARVRVALTGTPIENGLGDLWSILDFTNPGLVGPRPAFIAALSKTSDTRSGQAEDALRALNGILVFRRTKSEPAIAAELPDRIDELDHCTMTPEQIGLYQAVLDKLVVGTGPDGDDEGTEPRKGQILAAITALKQICNHPAAYQDDDRPLEGRSGKLARLDEIVESVYDAGERVLVFTHFAKWGERLAHHLTQRFDIPVSCYHGGLSRGARDKMIADFQAQTGPGALVLSLKAGGTGLNLTNANHVVLYDRWWNPAVEDQARDRAWRIGQKSTVIAHRLVCPGTVDERVEEVVAGKRRIADMVLPKSSSLADLDAPQLRAVLGLRTDELLTDEPEGSAAGATPSEDAA